jgi:threonine dehydrogenase-like Zn-dependent dehydrogenase
VRAAVVGTGRSVRVVDIERPAPTVAEVLVDVACCGVCGSDLHMLSAGLVTAGQVLGHEFTGVVAGLGPGVTGWTAGDRVAVLPVVACGQCYACRVGRPNLCEEQGIDHGSLVYDEQDFASALAHLAAGSIPCDKIITAVAPLADAPSLISDLQAGTTEQVKVLLAPGQPATSPG